MAVQEKVCCRLNFWTAWVKRIYIQSLKLWLNLCSYRRISPNLKCFIIFNCKVLWILYLGLGTAGLQIFNREFLGGATTELYVTFSVDPFIHCPPYFTNHTSSDDNFCDTCVKWWYLEVFVFLFFLILIFQAVRVGWG